MPRRPSKLTAWYVTARIDPGTANQRTAWLCGPFDTERAALAMVEPVQWACRRYMDDMRYQFAYYSHAKLTVPADQELPPGRMSLHILSNDDVVARIVAPRTDWRNRDD
jgi:hypothetical protein